MNYKNFIKGLFVVALMTTMTSCSDDDSNLFENPHFAAFLGQDSSVVVSEGEDPVTIDLGITKIQSQDVTITMQVTDETAVQGTDYSLSATSVTIPAGEYTGGISITPVDNDIFNAAKTLILEITAVSASGLNIGNIDEYSYKRTIVISNDDCPTKSDLWWGDLSVEDVGFGSTPGSGSANSSGDCDVLLITNDLPGASAGSGPFELYFTPYSLGATAGTIDVPAQTYCTACSAGLDALYSATGTYDEVTQTIILFYSLDRSDGANFWTGTNVITPQ